MEVVFVTVSMVAIGDVAHVQPQEYCTFLPLQLRLLQLEQI